MFTLTGFQRDCLYVIGGLDEPSGLDVKKALDEYYENDIYHGRLYPNLDELAENGLIEKGHVDDRTNSYALTEDGKHALANRREWENDRVDHLGGDVY